MNPGRWQRMGHGTRVFVLALAAGAPALLVALALAWYAEPTAPVAWAVTLVLLGSWIGGAMVLRAHVTRPLGTLANMLAALREGDFSIRARVVDARDPLSLVYHEVNALEETLRNQRLGAVEATETLRKVLEEIDVAVFAFDPEGVLRIVNRAGERLLGQAADRLIGRRAGDVRLADTLSGSAPRTVELSFPGGAGRWELRRSVVRQEGYRFQLVALSDLSRALREEERQAWKRIIRVLSHEINNSLTPIKSISGSLKAILARSPLPADVADDAERGLGIIENRAESLGRFMAAYTRLARLPPPEVSDVDLEALVRRTAGLETRLGVDVVGGPPVALRADPDQLEQALINLVRNAVDATLESDAEGGVSLRWLARGGKVQILVEDDGPGVEDSGNLFVPFYTTKPGGSGIGLVLARQIVEGHGGALVLESRGTRPGVRARVTLPLDGVA